MNHRIDIEISDDNLKESTVQTIAMNQTIIPKEFAEINAEYQKKH